MPVVRYTVAGQFGGRGVSAFTPAPPRSTANFSIKFAQQQTPVHQPGTQGVPAPYDLVDGSRSADNVSGGLSRSFYMPPAWYPTLGYAVQRIYDANFGGVRIYSDNLMPIPATDPRRLPAGIQGPVVQAGTNHPPARPNRRSGGLGQRQVTWPYRSIRWPG
jgi:hypothetical protein